MRLVAFDAISPDNLILVRIVGADPYPLVGNRYGVTKGSGNKNFQSRTRGLHVNLNYHPYAIEKAFKHDGLRSSRNMRMLKLAHRTQWCT
jgi:hypothetical protein